jgi:hypothetical protein
MVPKIGGQNQSVCNLRPKHLASSSPQYWSDKWARPTDKGTCRTSCKKTSKDKTHQWCMGQQSRLYTWPDGKVLKNVTSMQTSDRLTMWQSRCLSPQPFAFNHTCQIQTFLRALWLSVTSSHMQCQAFTVDNSALNSPVPCLSVHALMHVTAEFYGDPILDTKASTKRLSQRIKKTEWKHASIYLQKSVSSKLPFQVNKRCKRSVYHWICDKRFSCTEMSHFLYYTLLSTEFPNSTHML